MSDSKARMRVESQTLRENRDQLYRQLGRLLGYVHDVQMANPNIHWPPLPDQDDYSETLWRSAA